MSLFIHPFINLSIFYCSLQKISVIFKKMREIKVKILFNKKKDLFKAKYKIFSIIKINSSL